MNDLNVVCVVGRLTRDPELKVIGSSTLCKFAIASNSKFKEKEHTDFFEIVCWAGLADTCSKYISKGSQIAIKGRLTQETWESKDGEKRSKITITAENIQFVGAKKEKGGKVEGVDESNSDTKDPFG